MLERFYYYDYCVSDIDILPFLYYPSDTRLFPKSGNNQMSWQQSVQEVSNTFALSPPSLEVLYIHKAFE